MINIDKLGKLILASKSPRREEILKKMNLNFKIIPSDAVEDLDKTSPSVLLKNAHLKKRKRFLLQIGTIM